METTMPTCVPFGWHFTDEHDLQSQASLLRRLDDMVHEYAVAIAARVSISTSLFRLLETV